VSSKRILQFVLPVSGFHADSRNAGNFIYRAKPDGLTMGVMLSSFVPAATTHSINVQRSSMDGDNVR